MPEKSLQTRLVEQSANFRELYMQFENAHATRVEAGYPANPWATAFDVPFEESLEDRDVKIAHSEQHFYVIKTIRKLGLHKLRLGGVFTSNDDVRTLLQLRALDNRDAQSLENQYNTDDQPKIVKGLEPDRSDAIFWRTLLEIFCRAFTPPRGRPRRSGLSDEIHLVFDLDEILREHLRGRWDEDKAIEKLTSVEPYRDRYAGGPSHSGISAARLKRIEDWIGPFDDGMLERASNNNPDAFWEVLEERNLRIARTQTEIEALIETLRKPLLQPNPANYSL